MLRVTGIAVGSNSSLDHVVLKYEDRFRRRISMTTEGGIDFLLDLPKATELADGDHLQLEDGRTIRVCAASEPLAKVTADDAKHLTRIAWHIGNRHLPCEIHPERLIIQQDHVIEEMVIKLGGRIEHIEAPFNPEGGAYGKGRTHDHDH